jgi:hypothetical protein
MMRLRSFSIKIGAVITTVYSKLLRRSRIETMRLHSQYTGPILLLHLKQFFTLEPDSDMALTLLNNVRMIYTLSV